MSDINVRESLGTIDPIKKPSELRWAKWDAETAFNRLQVSRETRKILTDGINANVESLPLETREMYDQVIRLMKEIESAEIRTIKFGE